MQLTTISSISISTCTCYMTTCYMTAFTCNFPQLRLATPCSMFTSGRLRWHISLFSFLRFGWWHCVFTFVPWLLLAPAWRPDVRAALNGPWWRVLISGCHLVQAAPIVSGCLVTALPQCCQTSGSSLRWAAGRWLPLLWPQRFWESFFLNRLCKIY